MATAVCGRDTDVIHGVVHGISLEEKAVLDASESTYDCVEVVAIVSERSFPCFTYVMQPEFLKEETLPSERYIDVLVEGCRQHEVTSEWIAMLRAHTCIPRPKAADYAKLALPPEGSSMTRDELAAMPDLAFAINGKIFLFAGDRATPEGRNFLSRIQHFGGGRDHTLDLARKYYEPLCPEPLSLDGMSEEHRAYAEHISATRYPDPASNMKPVAWLSD
eukprot:gnl/MRDRNA2_/MRDRNA2_68596_c0_seq1.p1 gnl/MRDRNA2_/MRDRNA2_68596_c0~~gnl/MRDRNA2_/MRDRNA2_68596_c0_seq1.p1  ORF type:complete len:244 (-),score=37.14 gnl/MRDRNA2_/MRDRNA2_68596_c0_seq1:29-685(-)